MNCFLILLSLFSFFPFLFYAVRDSSNEATYIRFSFIQTHSIDMDRTEQSSTDFTNS